MSKHNKFITIEGSEGVGKSTLVTFLKAWFESQKIPVLFTREPGGTHCGEMIRDILLHKNDEAILPISELLLLFTARAQHIAHVIQPALAAGQWVVCDRFTDASYAYQGAGRGLPDAQIHQLQTWVQGDLQIDATLLLDMPVDIALERIQRRGELDRFESEHIAFFERIRQCYLQRAAAEPQRFHIIDAQQPIVDVQTETQQILQQLTDENAS